MIETFTQRKYTLPDAAVQHVTVYNPYDQPAAVAPV